MKFMGYESCVQQCKNYKLVGGWLKTGCDNVVWLYSDLYRIELYGSRRLLV